MAAKKKPPEGHGWKPGQSGNPKGRPKGSGDVAQLRAAIAEHLPQILEAMVQRAVEGDVGAARLLLERTVAPLKATDMAQQLNLPQGSLTDQGRAVMTAVSQGQLTPSQGTGLIGAIAALARVAELDELAARVAALEKHYGKS